MKQHPLRRLWLLLALIPLIVGSGLLVPTTTARAADTGGYPFAAYKGPGSNPAQFIWTDPSGGQFSNYHYNYRNCTDYVAWKLDTSNGWNPHVSMGNAISWKSWANNSNHKYTVDNTPAIGSVAWWNGHKWNDGYGHVAYVLSTDGTNVTLGEYNFNLSSLATYGTYSTRTISASKVDNFIHFKDIVGNGATSSPTVISRTPSSMDVFFRDANNNLVNKGWDANTGWHSQSWSDNIAGTPAAVVRGTNAMDVFFRTQSNGLANQGWSASNGWHAPVILVSGGVAGNPAVISRTATSMDVFFRSTNGSLMNIGWDATAGWHSVQTLMAADVTGDPMAISRTATSMDVFFSKNNGNLVNQFWNVNAGWQRQDWPASVVGTPAAVSRNSGRDMSVYYQESNGNVAERYWNVSTGWHWQDWSAQLAGSPTVISRTNVAIDSFYREIGGNIVNRYWNATNGWATQNITRNATSDPSAVVRGSEMEVFYWSNSTLADAHWDATNGWRGYTVG